MAEVENLGARNRNHNQPKNAAPFPWKERYSVYCKSADGSCDHCQRSAYPWWSSEIKSAGLSQKTKIQREDTEENG